MADFPSAVNAPGGASYAAPLMSFSNFSNWAADDPYKKIVDQQIQQLNQQRLTQGQQAIDLSKAFPNGLPKGPDGQTDYPAIAQVFAKFGDPAGAVNVMQQAPVPQSPLLGGGGVQPGAPGAPAASGAGVAPASVQAKPLPPPAANSPRGDPGTGSITDIVTDRLPSQNVTTGQTILKIADVMGVDPNATLTPGQLKRAQGLLQKYAPEIAGQGGGGASPSAASAAAVAPAVPANGAPASFDSRFGGGSGGDTGDLPPSANAVSPAPRVTAPPAGGAGPAQPQPPQAVPPQGPQMVAPAGPQGAPQAGPAAQPQGPIVPQVPLPKGFTDPQQAILALRAEAARLSANPRAAGQVAELNNYAARIEASLQPLTVGSMTSLIDPRTGKTIYQGPGAQAYRGPGGETGKLVAMENAERTDRGERPMTAQEEVSFIQGIHPPRSAPAMAVEAFKKDFEAKNGRPPNGSEIQSFNAQQAGASAEEKAVGQRAGSLAVAVQETHDTIPNVLALAETNAGKGLATWDKIENKWKVEKGDEGFANYVQQLNSLVNLYGRVISGGGKGTVSDNEHAREMLNPNMPLSAVKGSLKGFVTEINIAERAPETVRARMRGVVEGTRPTKDTTAQKAARSPGGYDWYVIPEGGK